VSGGGAPPAGAGGDGQVAGGGTGNAGGAPAGTGGTFHSPPCNLNTGYAGDDECIMPPPADKGFQLHVGPTDYKNPGVFLMQPGQEATTDFPSTSGNTSKIFFYFREYRFRPTAHHVIISTSDGAGTGGGIDITGGRRIGTANRSEDFPAGGIIPPENKDVGIPLNAKVAINTSFHAINTDTEPQLREMWVNFWYRDPADVKQSATEWFNIGDATFAIPPNAKVTLGPYTCTVQGAGHLLWLYGHRHANNTRFTVSRIRAGKTDVIYDANKWEEPLLLEYASTVTNPAPDPTGVNEGGWSGILDLAQGDQIKWSCNVENHQTTTLRFTNNTYTGEMCIVDAEAVGSTCAGL
jgi:hypothetical protein